VFKFGHFSNKIFPKCKIIIIYLFISSHIFFFGEIKSEFEKKKKKKEKEEFFGHISIWILEGGGRKGFSYPNWNWKLTISLPLVSPWF
jgi:hypothetical protein